MLSIRTRSQIVRVVAVLACITLPTASFAHGGGHSGGGGHGGGGGGGHSSGGQSFGGGHSTGSTGAQFLVPTGGAELLGAYSFGSSPFGGVPFTDQGIGGSGFGGAMQAGSGVGAGEPGFGRFGGQYGGYLYIGPSTAWSGAGHWGSGFWAEVGDGWAWYTGAWWVSPEYPGWVWMGPPWVWDGEHMIAQDGYWTTVNMPEGGDLPSFVEPEAR